MTHLFELIVRHYVITYVMSGLQWLCHFCGLSARIIT